MSKRILVTGGAGFIGSAVARHLIRDTEHAGAVNVDKLTYAGNLDSLAPVARTIRATASSRPTSATADRMRELFAELSARRRDAPGRREPRRPLDRRARRVHPDQRGRHLHAARRKRSRLLARPARGAKQTPSAFITSRPTRCSARSAPSGIFTETTAYEPHSPYSASKAASDHLVRAWHHTYGLPVVVTNCSNNYGPYHFPEKLIPLVILNALARAEACRSTARATTCATGSTWTITRARSSPSSPRATSARPTNRLALVLAASCTTARRVHVLE